MVYAEVLALLETAPLLWDHTYSTVREAFKGPIDNLELKIAPHVNFVTVNIGLDAPKTGWLVVRSWRGSSPSSPSS